MFRSSNWPSTRDEADTREKEGLNISSWKGNYRSRSMSAGAKSTYLELLWGDHRVVIL